MVYEKNIQQITLILGILFVSSYLICQKTESEFIETITITLGVTFYHFGMRVVVGFIIDILLHNQVDYQKIWFKINPFEAKVYELIKVKQWKKYMPTYSPESFDISKHSFEEVVMSGCQAEIVHEVIMVLSLMPVFLIYYYEAKIVFIFTSIVAALFDGIFVVIQRYNRPRLLKLMKRRKLR